MASNKMVHVGPWGGSGGDPWHFVPNGQICGINIRSGYVVDAISFSFKDQSGTTYDSRKFGGDGGVLHEISFADDEELKEISGTVGMFGNLTVVTSLAFKTTQNTYSGYGTYDGTDFSVPVTEGKISGFHGRFGDLLDSIGVVLSP